MIDIGATEFFFEIPKMTRKQLEDYSNQLFDSWESFIPSTVSLDDYSTVLEIEEGSIKGKGTLFAGLGAIYVFVSQYGAFIQGLQIIRSQVISVGDYLGATAKNNSGGIPNQSIVRHRAGTLNQIQKLFYKVQRQDISIEVAMQEAREILGEEVDSSPEFMEKLRSSLEIVPIQGKQIDLPLGDVSTEQEPDEDNKDSTQRSSRPRQAVIPTNLYRIEISRESKRGKKNVKIIEL